MRYLKRFNESIEGLYSSTYFEDVKILDDAKLDVEDILLELEDDGWFKTVVSNRTWSKVVEKQPGVIEDRAKFYKCYSMIIDITKEDSDQYHSEFDINDIKETLFRLEDYIKSNIPSDFIIEYVDYVDKRIDGRHNDDRSPMVRIVKIAINRENNDVVLVGHN